MADRCGFCGSADGPFTRVFERYTRLDRPTGSPSGGLGLGLFIARRLARANGGWLRLTDPPDGQGARFELRLPLAPPASSTARAQP